MIRIALDTPCQVETMFISLKILVIFDVAMFHPLDMSGSVELMGLKNSN